MIRKASVLSLVDFFSQVLDPRADRERLGFQWELFFFEHFERISRAVTDRQDNIVGFEKLCFAVALDFGGAYRTVLDREACQLGFKKHASAETDDFFAEVLYGWL